MGTGACVGAGVVVAFGAADGLAVGAGVGDDVGVGTAVAVACAEGCAVGCVEAAGALEGTGVAVAAGPRPDPELDPRSPGPRPFDSVVRFCPGASELAALAGSQPVAMITAMLRMRNARFTVTRASVLGIRSRRWWPQPSSRDTGRKYRTRRSFRTPRGPGLLGHAAIAAGQVVATLGKAIRVSEASAVGADITAAAVGAVEGAIEIAKDTAVSAEDAAAAAASGAIDAAADIGEVAATRVRSAVEGTIQGVKVVAKKTVS